MPIPGRGSERTVESSKYVQYLFRLSKGKDILLYSDTWERFLLLRFAKIIIKFFFFSSFFYVKSEIF